jgi:hypothetical protein
MAVQNGSTALVLHHLAGVVGALGVAGRAEVAAAHLDAVVVRRADGAADRAGDLRRRRRVARTLRVLRANSRPPALGLQLRLVEREGVFRSKRVRQGCRQCHAGRR